jgi:hypothetical protein
MGCPSFKGQARYVAPYVVLDRSFASEFSSVMRGMGLSALN